MTGSGTEPPARPANATGVTKTSRPPRRLRHFMDTNYEPQWIPNYSTGAYGGLDERHKRRRRKHPIGFAPPKETTMTPYRDRLHNDEYQDKPATKTTSTTKTATKTTAKKK